MPHALLGSHNGGRELWVRDGMLRVPQHLPGTRDAPNYWGAHPLGSLEIQAETTQGHEETIEASILDRGLPRFELLFISVLFTR